MRAIILAALMAPAISQDLFLASSAAPRDLKRARSRMPAGSLLAARTAAAIAGKVNDHLRLAAVPHRPCADFAHGELIVLARALWQSSSDELQQIYADVGDRRALAYGSLEELEQQWAARNGSWEALEEKCAELLMFWAHHLGEAAKRAIGQKHVLPTLPVYDPDRHAAEKFTCVNGHNNTEEGWDGHAASYADGWPDEVTYTATGHGPYPFWLGRVDADIDEGAPLKVWWSKTQQAEKFYHEVCQIGNAGYSQTNAPCYSLMLTGTSYFYTAAEDFCCISGSPTSGQKFVLTASQFDWFKGMTYEGEADYEGEYYSGKIKNYTMDCTGTQTEGCGPGAFHIWYYTDLNDRPIEQGEGCQITPRTSQCNGASYLFHQYNPDSWTEGPIDASFFEAPEVCKTTTKMCLYP